MLKYNNLYQKVKEDQVADNGVFDSEYMMYWVEKTRSKRKWRLDHSDLVQSKVDQSVTFCYLMYVT
jgi:hypothetical protein